ncbi:unnamed protein product, partial [Ixodes persulcatus]
SVVARYTSTPSGAATSLSLSSDDADGSQAYGTTFGLFLGGSSFSSSDGTPLPLLSDVVMARLSDGEEIDELRKNHRPKSPPSLRRRCRSGLGVAGCRVARR